MDNHPSPSMKIHCEEQEYADFTGRVLCHYQVGKDKLNHGTGYRVETGSGRIYEIVIWA
jgi:hypothetical protein